MKVGVSPIAWRNEDFPELRRPERGDDLAFSRCLAEIRDAGYAGTELGHGFPRDPRVLRAALDQHDLELISGWYPSCVLLRSAREEERAFAAFLDHLAAAGGAYAVVSESTRCVQRDRGEALRFRVGPTVLSPPEWDRLAAGIERLAALAHARGIALVYHPHVGTVVQDQSQVSELLKRTSSRVRLTADTGHIRFAGDDPLEFFEDFSPRIGLVHFKDVRASLLERFVAKPSSFYDAVVSGVFTVPGDGDLDFIELFEVLRGAGYDGWLVVEAEQDPKKADPFLYSKRGREALRAALGV